VRSGTSWTQQAQLTAADGAADDLLGRSVAISGDTALVGGGSTYVFTRSGTSWSQQAELTAAGGTVVGFSLALSGDTALAGNPWYAIGGNPDQGLVYVFTRSGATWSQEATLTAADGTADDRLGYSVALAGDTALVGSYWDDDGSSIHQGSAYVFVRSGTSWGQQAKLRAADGSAYDCFGASVALFGDTALVGAFGDGGAGVPANAYGSAYVFTRSVTSWSQQTKLMAYDAAAGDWFGSSVALSGETALVGAPNDAVGTPSANVNQGSAAVFLLDSTLPTTIALTSGRATSLAYGATFAVKGTLKAEGAGLVGRRIILQSATPGGSFADTSLSATTTAGGAFTFSVKPTIKTYYRARFAGATGCEASGPTVSVYATPKTWVRTPIAPTTMYRTKYYTVYGHLKPRHTAGTYPVRLYKWKRTSTGAWKGYGYVSAKASNYSTYTKYSRSIRLPYAGKWKVRAYAPGDALHAAAWSSGYDYVTVK